MTNAILSVPEKWFLNRLRIIVIDNPYVLLQREPSDSAPLRLFFKLLSLKARGYSPPNYPPTFLTFDAADFVATHYLFCIEEETGLEIAGIIKVASLKRCDFYQIRPPYYGLTFTAEAVRHKYALEKIYSDARKGGYDVVSGCGFTVDPKYRGKEECSIIKALSGVAMYDSSVRNGNAATIGVGVPRFKTEKIWEKMGFKIIEDEQGPLPTFPLPTSNNEPLLLMKVNEYSEWTKQCREQYRSLWDNREIFGAERRPERMVA